LVGKTTKWTGGVLALLAVIGLVASTSESLSCAEIQYSGGTMVDCESMATFEPRMRERDSDSDEETRVSIPLPPWVIGVLGAMGRGSCKTTEIAEGQWTVCNDGFSMLEREGASAARALGLRPGEKRRRNARAPDDENRARERQQIERALEQARKENTALHARLKEMAAYEAELELAESAR
jgi:hypothetical protein